MTDQMNIDEYLAEGGILTSPDNVPARYRAELMRLMATFVDSELAGAAGFADLINAGPGINERIAAAYIVAEKNQNAADVLKLMGDFGADIRRYATHHPWTERMPRGADIGAARVASDMRLAVFNYPLTGWIDAVVMNFLMGLAVGHQLAEFSKVSYQPLASAFRKITPIEARHVTLADKALGRICACTDVGQAQISVDYWWPRVAASFGQVSSAKLENLRRWGLRHDDNMTLRTQWRERTLPLLSGFGLQGV